MAAAPELLPAMPARVLQLGPALEVRGGISSVERLIVEHPAAAVSIRHVATMEDGSPLRKAAVFMRAVRTLRAALCTDPEVLVHIHFSSRGSTLRKLVLAWMTLRAGRPLVLHAHGSVFDQFYDGLPRPAQAAVRRIFSRADCFLVLSTQWKRFYLARFALDESRIRVLCNPAFLPPQAPRREGRARVQFLFLGRIGRRKGAFDLLAAFAALAPAVRSRCRLVFAGDGEVEALRVRARPFGAQVEVQGWIDGARCAALLQESDVFVLPSYHEGVPMALLEAMAFGLPLVTTPVGGIPDVVTDGVEGLMIHPGDIAHLQAAMASLVDDEPLRLTLGQRARRRAEGLDVSRYSMELGRIYRQLLERERVRGPV